MGTLALAFNVRSDLGSGTVYIRADGSIDPPTAPISTVDYVTYTFADNIYDAIVIERDNVVVDGEGYTLQGTGTYPSAGINLSGRENVTIRNTQIKNFWNGIYFYGSSNNIVSGNNITANRIHGIWLYSNSNYNIVSGNTIANSSNGIGLGLYAYSNYNSISGNNVANNGYGIVFHHSSNNSISGNSMTGNSGHGFWLDSYSNYNIVSGNTIASNGYGIVLYYSSNNSVSGNNITANNYRGFWLYYHSDYNSISGNTIASNGYGIVFHSSSNNSICHNNFIDNNRQVYDWAEDYSEVSPSVNVWDDGYPSGGNYWSDSAGEDANGDGIDDTRYVIDGNNQDNYPLMNPWTPVEEASPLWMQWWFLAIIAAGIAVSAGAAYFLKKRNPPTTPHPQKGTDAISVTDE